MQNNNISIKKSLFLKNFFLFQTLFLLVLLPIWFLCQVAFEDSVKERLVASAQAAALAYDGDVLEGILSAESPDFIKTQKINLRLESMYPDIRFVYTMRKNVQNQIVFLVDAMSLDRNGNGIIDENEKAAKFAEVYSQPTKAMQKAFYQASADDAPNTDRWGTFVSGYAPIYNGKSEVVAIVGLDMDVQTFRSKQDQLRLAFLVGLAISFAFSLLIAIFSHQKN